MPDILHRVGIKSSLNAAYRALTTRDGLAGWWTRDTQGNGACIGDKLRFGFSAGGVEVGAFEMQVLALELDAKVLWQVTDGPEEWIGTQISWTLKQEGDYCIVLFKHLSWPEPVEFMHHCSTKWAIFLMSLKSLLETGQGAASPDDVKIDNWN